MANIKSQKKSIRQDEKRAARNKSYKSAMKTAIKKAKVSGDAKDINAAVKLIDGAVTKHVIHKNKAATLKSKVMKAAK
jgi:small subunit ribosomal protein S20